MRILLDTHVLFWWFNSSQSLSRRAISLLGSGDHEVLISAASAWELAIKVNLGKIRAINLLADLGNYIKDEGFSELPINMTQAVRAGLLPRHHDDPFDRLLVAQAQDLNIPILSADELLDRYDIKRLW